MAVGRGASCLCLLTTVGTWYGLLLTLTNQITEIVTKSDPRKGDPHQVEPAWPLSVPPARAKNNPVLHQFYVFSVLEASGANRQKLSSPVRSEKQKRLLSLYLFSFWVLSK
jgi:hypothetical protein